MNLFFYCEMIEFLNEMMDRLIQSNFTYWTFSYWTSVIIEISFVLRPQDESPQFLIRTFCLLGNSVYWEIFSWSLEKPNALCLTGAAGHHSERYIPMECSQGNLLQCYIRGRQTFRKVPVV